ncbi:transposase family protein, partial [Thiolapillus sp.]|uniref:transposase family protein n=2 Tax=Thiolapillus sp. TaxID=2017437 RepID=UPI003AF700EB
MRDKDLYAQILGIKSPWQVSGVELALSEGEVTVHVEQEEGVQHCCPTCGEVSPGYDSRKRKWRHLDTCQYKTILVADVPRVKCKEHGVVTVSVPWAEPGSGFTAMVTTHPYQHRAVPKRPFEWRPADCIPDLPWSAGNWRCGNRP